MMNQNAKGRIDAAVDRYFKFQYDELFSEIMQVIGQSMAIPKSLMIDLGVVQLRWALAIHPAHLVLGNLFACIENGLSEAKAIWERYQEGLN